MCDARRMWPPAIVNRALQNERMVRGRLIFQRILPVRKLPGAASGSS